MRHDLVVSQSIEVNAEPSKVWHALTTPEIIKEYLFGTETVTDWKPGSEIKFQGVYGENLEHSYCDKGVILENIPNRVLSYSYWSGFSGLPDSSENYAQVIYTLEPIGDSKTKFTWTQKGFAGEEGYQHSRDGMTAFLEQIRDIIEKRKD